MDDESDDASTELDSDPDDNEVGFHDENGVYIDRLRGFGRLATDRLIAASGTNIHVAFLEGQELNCLNILLHCKRQIDAVRVAYGGDSSVFKIGVTSAPVARFDAYLDENFDAMTLIHISESYHLTYMLEAALIQSYNHVSGCRNENLGGDGPMHTFPPPYYAYVVAARGDGRLRIGG